MGEVDLILVSVFISSFQNLFPFCRWTFPNIEHRYKTNCIRETSGMVSGWSPTHGRNFKQWETRKVEREKEKDSERRTRNEIKRGQKRGTQPLSSPDVPFVPVECGRCLYPLLLVTVAIAETTPIDNCLFRKIAPRPFHFRTAKRRFFSARARTRSECARSRNAAREIPTGCCLAILARVLLAEIIVLERVQRTPSRIPRGAIDDLAYCRFVAFIVRFFVISNFETFVSDDVIKSLLD